MLNENEVLAKYRENYLMAIDDGHTEEASKIAWEWTEEYVMDRFITIKSNYQNAQQEAINKAFFG